MLQGPCRGPLVRGPVTVTGDGRRGSGTVLTAALPRCTGCGCGPGGTTVHLTGYGDATKDLDPAPR